MSQKDVRRGMAQYELNQTGANLLATQYLIVSIILGVYFRSWWVFGGVFLGAVIMPKSLKLIMAILMPIGAGVGVYLIADWLFSVGAGVVLGIITTLALIGANLSGLTYYEDITTADE